MTIGFTESEVNPMVMDAIAFSQMPESTHKYNFSDHPTGPEFLVLG